jgi:hypothetical protein
MPSFQPVWPGAEGDRPDRNRSASRTMNEQTLLLHFHYPMPLAIFTQLK